MNSRCFFILTVLFLLVVSTITRAEPPTSKPTTYGRLALLEPGSVRPEGWLGRYTTTIANGWPLLYAKERVPMVYDQCWARNGMTGDYSAYYADGIMRLCHQLPDCELAREQLAPWLKQVLASQDPDGYLGGYPERIRWGHGEPGCDQWLDIFSQSIWIQVLLYQYQTSGDEALFQACQRSAARIIQAYHQPENEVKHFIFEGLGVIVVRPMRDLYLLTGKQEYVDFAKEVLGKYGKQDAYLRYYDDKNLDCMTGQHAVIEAEKISYPITVYEMTGDERLKKASIAGWEMLAKYVSVDGQPVGNENLGKPLARALMEHCGSVDWTITNHELVRVLGEVRYADAAERALFNSYPGAKSPDTLTCSYMHQANQLVAAEWGPSARFRLGTLVLADLLLHGTPAAMLRGQQPARDRQLHR